MAFQNSADDVQARPYVTGAQAGGLPMLIAALAQGAQGGGQQRTPFDPSGSQPLLTPNNPGPYGGGNPLPLAPPDALGGGFVAPPQPQPLITPHGPGDVPQGGAQTGSASSGLQTLAPYISQIVNPGGGRMPGAFPQNGLGTGNPQQGGGLTAPPQPETLVHAPPEGPGQQGGGIGSILQLLGGLFGGGQGQQGGMGGIGGLLGLLQGVLGGGMGHGLGAGFGGGQGQGQPQQGGFQNNMGPYSQRLAQGLGGNRNFYTPHNNVPQGIPPIMYALMAMQQHMRQTQPVMRQQPQGPAQPQPATGQPQGSLMDNPGGNPQNNMAHNPAIDRFRARRGLEE